MKISLKTRFQYRSIMDMTPLIDFAFSLLIFFMMTYNSNQSRLSSIIVNLPKALKVTVVKKTDLVVSVNEKNEVYLNNDKCDVNDLLNEFKKRKGSLADEAVIIKGDRKSNYETIVKIMDYLNRAGIRKFTLATIKSQ